MLFWDFLGEVGLHHLNTSSWLDVQKCLLVFDFQVFMFAGIWALDRPRLNLSFWKQHETCRQEVRCRMLIFVVDSIKELLSLFQISENADPTFC